MKHETSGKIFRFKMEHELGYGFAEVYDFTDESNFDGRFVFVYNRIDLEEKDNYELSEIKSSKIALGPITLYKFPNVKGIRSWKYLFQTKDFLLDKIPETKYLQGLWWTDDNWNNHKNWYIIPRDMQKMPVYLDHEKIRYLETRILSAPSGVVIKFSMKKLLDEGKRVSDYYDLSETGNRNLFVQLINTYYPLKKTLSFLKQLPTESAE